MTGTQNSQLTEPRKEPKPAWRLVRIALGYLVGGACLYWVFHDINLHQLLRSLEGINWSWIMLGAALQILTYVCVAFEWQLLLQPVGRISLLKTSQAVFAGRFANDVLPVQIGYLIRVYLVSRWLRTDLATVVPSLLVERLWDGFWLAVGIGLMTLFVPLPPELLRARDILAVVVLLGTAPVLFLIFRKKQAADAVTNRKPGRCKLVQKAAAFVVRMVEGVRTIGKSRLLPAVLMLAALKLLIQAGSYYAIVWGYGFHLSVWVGMAVFLIAYLGICIPSTPASAGVFQVFSIAGLTLFGIPKTPATGFSLVAFVVTTAPLTLAGFLALAHSGLSLRQIRNEITALQKTTKEPKRDSRAA